MRMNAKQEADRLATVSKRAQKLYARINNYGRFYRAYEKNIPKAMQELLDAKLIQTGGRVNVIISCYVPVRGFRPLRLEDWSGLQ